MQLKTILSIVVSFAILAVVAFFNTLPETQQAAVQIQPKVEAATEITPEFSPTDTEIPTVVPGTDVPSENLPAPSSTPVANLEYSDPGDYDPRDAPRAEATAVPTPDDALADIINLRTTRNDPATLTPAPPAPPVNLLPLVQPSDLAGFAIPPLQIARGNTAVNKIALTFDTGQGTPIVRIILQELRDAQVHATFFLMGSWVAQNGDLVRTMVVDGHALANHSYSHPNFTTLTDAQMLWQVITTENLIERATGCTSRPFFRAPFGSADARVLYDLGLAGFHNIMWSTHGADWLPDATMQTVYTRVVQNTGNGTIIVLHSSVPATAQAVPLIINELRARGFQFVTMSELLSSDAAHPYRAPCVSR